MPNLYFFKFPLIPILWFCQMWHKWNDASHFLLPSYKNSENYKGRFSRENGRKPRFTTLNSNMIFMKSYANDGPSCPLPSSKKAKTFPRLISNNMARNPTLCHLILLTIQINIRLNANITPDPSHPKLA